MTISDQPPADKLANIASAGLETGQRLDKPLTTAFCPLCKGGRALLTTASKFAATVYTAATREAVANADGG